MDKKGQASIALFVVLFIGVIVVLAMAPVIFSNSEEVRSKLTATDEVVSVSTAKLAAGNFNASVDLGPVAKNPTTTGAWAAANCPLESITVTNASGTALTVTTDYTLDTTTGVLNIKNTTATVNAFATNNNSLIDYTYCAAGYGTSAGARSAAGLIGLLAMLGLLGFVIWGALGRTGVLKS